MEYLTEFCTVIIIHAFVLIAPGPDLFLVIKNSLIYSYKTGLYTSLGVTSGILVHIIYSLAGIGFIIAKSIVLFSIIKFIGAGYLIYIGYKSLKSKNSTLINSNHHIKSTQDINKFKALKTGFITNATNPKVTLFFLGLFTQVINPKTPFSIQLLYGLEMLIMTLIWFSVVSFVLSHPILNKKILKTQNYAEKILGAVLIAFGIKIAISNTN